MTWHKRSRPGEGTGATKGHQGDDDQHQTTADPRHDAPADPEACDSCGHPPPYDHAGPAWQLAWQLVGMPDPLPLDRWRHAIRAVVDAHGAHTAASGLELAAAQPATAPRHPDAPRARWWLDEHRQRAAAIAAELRRNAAEGMVDDAA